MDKISGTENISDLQVLYLDGTSVGLNFKNKIEASSIFIQQSENNGLTWENSVLETELTPYSSDAKVIGLKENTIYYFRLVTISNVVETITEDPYIYNLELTKWGVFNDGTHPIETTKGINDALTWAQKNKKKTFKVPSGVYLIKKGEPNDPESRINMVSDITFELDANTVLEKESNDKEGYELLYIGPGINNVKLQGGTYRGDRLTHDYTKRDTPYSSGTHESGYGILSQGAQNLIIENVKSEYFTGDGLCIGGKATGIRSITTSDLELGSLDLTGNKVVDPLKTRLKSPVYLTNDIFKSQKTFVFDHVQNISLDTTFDVYFFNSSNVFLNTINNQYLIKSFVPIPDDAYYFYVVFHSSNLNNVRLEIWSKVISKNVTVNNSDFSFNRRQGITVGGAENVTISNNLLHDINGTAPQSGIDVEAGFFPNNNININNNHFYNNKGYDLILFDGSNATIEKNIFESKAIGLAISKPFSGVNVLNNGFTNADITILGKNVVFSNNTISYSQINVTGYDIEISDTLLTDVKMTLDSNIPNGIKIFNLTLKFNGIPNTGLYLGNEMMEFRNIHMIGKTEGRNLSGLGSSKNVYENFVIEGYNVKYGFSLPLGTYNNCSFISTENENTPIKIDQSGSYILNDCIFENNIKSLQIENTSEIFNVEINNSTFKIKNNISYGVIFVKSAKKLNISGNTFYMKNLTNGSTPVLKIGPYGFSKPSQIFEVSIIGNEIYTNIVAIGIDTSNAGTDAPPYLIQDNTLYNAKLKLTLKDMNINNKELTN
ncbi:right-handed parallel beta-helix repeat-containing protein [Falsibacillus pallidus]|uniref:Parallel beta helix pectate lyase-like protein n=1 Tax=Falsibacillus pallidus TaxID=493781 RepID=A0A370GT79_9BACI|nr:right-handed parallel beta-helix repeat-containing protein [Falsibacillus pallidus]RDI45724.1 parallel beta helix pectate lyase-like protein [Falsibacillus pallidus]